MDALEVEVGADEHEAIDEVGPAKCDEHRHDAAVAPSDEVDLRCGAEVLEHLDGVRGHVVVVERLLGVGGVAVAATVEGDDAEAPDEVCCADRVEEVVAVAEAPVQEHDGALTASAGLGPGAHAVDVDECRHAASSPGRRMPRPSV